MERVYCWLVRQSKRAKDHGYGGTVRSLSQGGWSSMLTRVELTELSAHTHTDTRSLGLAINCPGQVWEFGAQRAFTRHHLMIGCVSPPLFNALIFAFAALYHPLLAFILWAIAILRSPRLALVLARRWASDALDIDFLLSTILACVCVPKRCLF